MKVNFFVISSSYDNSLKIELLYKLFGENIPKYKINEGGIDFNYLFCVESNVDVKSICENNNYKIGKFIEEEIDEKLYNNEYTIYYFMFSGKYKLIKEVR